MTEKGIKSGKQEHGLLEKMEERNPLVNGKECAYVYFYEHHIAKCAIEKHIEKRNRI